MARANAPTVVAAPPRAWVGLGVVGLGHRRDHLVEMLPKFRVVARDLVLPDPREQHRRATVGIAELGEDVLIVSHVERLTLGPDGCRLIEEEGRPSK